MQKQIVILTGAGISAESGLATFRDENGLWEGYRPEDVATPEAFDHDPGLVQRFYDARRKALTRVKPNAAHKALAKLERHFGDNLLIVTQNVDDLHERAGSHRVLHMHGSLQSSLCTHCDTRAHCDTDLADAPPCAACGLGTLRPDIVWFGELPYHMSTIERALQSCDLFVAIGTSGAVYPAAGFVRLAQAQGATSLELNLQETEISRQFDLANYGPASKIVPTWVNEELKS